MKFAVLLYWIRFSKNRKYLSFLKFLTSGVSSTSSIVSHASVDLVVFFFPSSLCNYCRPSSEGLILCVLLFKGGKHSSECTLILTEGDSAKSLAVSGLGVIGRDRYGVFPLRGKILNVREATHKQVWDHTLFLFSQASPNVNMKKALKNVQTLIGFLNISLLFLVMEVFVNSLFMFTRSWRTQRSTTSSRSWVCSTRRATTTPSLWGACDTERSWSWRIRRVLTPRGWSRAVRPQF